VPDREAVGHLVPPFGRAEQMTTVPEVVLDAAERGQEWNRRTCRLDTGDPTIPARFAGSGRQREDPKWTKPQGAEYRCEAQGRPGS
jgi:hypothetical protein